jgi:CheY-like chemotaxis protein
MTTVWFAVLKKHYSQILFVFLSFAVMVGASYFFIFSQFDQANTQIAVLLAVLGFAFAVILSRLLLNLSMAKMRLDEENSTKSTFLAHISHEFRTPLNSIIGLSELVLREDLPPYMQDHLLSIKRAGEDLLTIINDVMDMSVIEPSKVTIAAATYNFADLITSILETMRTLVDGKPIRFITKIDGTLPSVLRGDEMRIRQILLILLSNAIQNTRKGAIMWTVSGLKADNHDGTQKVFLSSVVTEEKNDSEEVTGLESGVLHLDVCKNLCSLMNGQLTENVHGRRTSFTAVIPQQIVDGGAFARVENAKKKTAVVYEQKTKNCESIEFTLQNLGVIYKVVRSEDELLSVFEGNENSETAEYFVFASAGLIHEAVEILKAGDFAVEFVMLAELNDSIDTEGIVPLFIPVHPLTVAKILNRQDGFQTRTKLKRRGEAFIAPNASVLVVDDIATNLHVASGLLAAYKMRVDCAMSGQDAIRKIRETDYDVVFMDHMMPEMDGVEAVQKIRKLGDSNHPQKWYKELPVVALTANAVPGISAFFLSNGFSDYLAKPVDVAELDRILVKWIPKNKQRENPESQESKCAESVLAARKFAAIKGVDAAKGIALTGGTEAGYRRVLASFVKDVEERLPVLKAERDIASFTMHVHALKGACSAIGSELSVQAAELEAAGKNGDAEKIEQNKNAFCAQLAELTENIKRVSASLADDAGKAGEIDAASLVLHLNILVAALQSRRMREADKALSHIELLTAGNSFAETVAAISDSILLGAYDDAIEKINGIREALQ